MINIQHPTLIIDRIKCLENIQRMKHKAKLNNLLFRPHFKTHQSRIVGELFQDENINMITVSSVQMALQFIYAGWKDITLAMPFNLRETEVINLISGETKINLLLDSIESIEHLSLHLKRKVGFFIKIDAGYHRTGVSYDDQDTIDKILFIAKGDAHLEFKGFLAHAGNTYDAENKEEILNIFDDQKRKLLKLKKEYSSYNPLISYGDTPSCSIANEFAGIDEIRPGNFVYYDLMQEKLGSCSINDIAVAVACPVISKNKNRNEIVIYGGAVHLSKEYITENNEKCFGKVVKLLNNGWDQTYENTFINRLSQEHGVIKTTKSIFDEIQIGDLIGILPVHSCLTADLLKDSYTFIN